MPYPLTPLAGFSCRCADSCKKIKRLHETFMLLQRLFYFVSNVQTAIGRKCYREFSSTALLTLSTQHICIVSK